MGKRFAAGLILVPVLLLLWVGGGSADTSGTSGPSGKAVKIGVLAPFTGEDSAKGKRGLQGIKTFLEAYPPLQNGDGIELVVGDDGNRQAYTVSVFKTLVEKEKVAAVLILSTSSQVLEINRIADQFETPVLALVASHPDIAENTGFVSQLCSDNRFQGKVAALYLRDEHFISKTAVFEDTGSTHSLSLSTVFREKFTALDGTVTGLIPVSISDEDLKSMLLNLQVLSTQCLYLPVDAEHFLRVSRLLREIEWAPLLMGGDGLYTSVAAEYEDDLPLLEDSLGIEVYSVDPKWAAFGNNLLKQYLREDAEGWDTYAMAGAEGIALVMDALNRCTDPGDRKELNVRLRRTVDFKGFMGEISLAPDGKAKRPLMIHTVKDGRPQSLVRVH